MGADEVGARWQPWVEPDRVFAVDNGTVEIEA
jgi:hypothetical protein